MFGRLMGFVGLNKIFLIIIGVLFASTATAGYLLKNSYQTIGEERALTNQWIAASEHWSTAYIELDAKLLAREKERNKAWVELGDLKEELRNIKDETNCIDTFTPDSLRLLFQDTTTN